MTSYRAVALQFTGTPLAPEANLTWLESSLRQAAADGARLVVIPELAVSGYTLDPVSAELAEPLDGPTVTLLAGLAAELDLVLVTTLLIGSGAEDLANVGVIITPDGLAASAAKRGLWGAESTLFTRGAPDEIAIADTALGRIGIAICYEAGFPEAARRLALAGAEVIAVPAAFGAARLLAWELLTRSRALENGCYLIAANAVGASAGLEFCGRSTIVDPFGHPLAVATNDQGPVAAPIDLALVEQARSAIPYLRDLTHVTAPGDVPHTAQRMGVL